jgi:hypothetical protein
MSSYVSAALRRLVESRARGLCEYCLIHQDDTFLGCQVEHIISEKHAGPTVDTNLALACVFCNRAKGTDLGSVLPTTGELCRFFNPRTDQWSDHFLVDGIRIVALTDIGQVTVRMLQLNDADRLLEREQLGAVGRYPSRNALLRMEKKTT